MLKIFNTLTGQKEIFEPLKPKRAGMYACGVTVYDYSHLGHARSALVFDVIRNYFRFSGYAVKYVRNFTDIDDKIINRASEEGKTWKEIAKKYLLAYKRDMKRLGVVEADVEPKATEHIPGIIRLIQTLIEKGHAYRLNGDVYYEVKTYPAYGRLSKRKAEDLLAGARVEVDERKRDPMDFALWKSSKAGEPAWDSPWGPGRPGWHIECSAMSMKHLGKTFDIHGGGMDLIFPHHENEIAQSCAATGKEFARYWIHNGFVQVNQEKMSKSLGNFFTIREVFEKWNMQWRTKVKSKCDRLTAEALRYFLLTTHYRSPLDFSDVGLQEARSALNGFYDLFKRLRESSVETRVSDVRVKQAIGELENSFRQAMDDDFNTPAAIAALHRLRGEINRLPESGLSRQVREKTVKVFRQHGKVLGLFQVPVRDWEFGTALSDDYAWAKPIVQPTVPPKQPIRDEQDDLPGDAAIERQVAERNEARRNKDFTRADAIRKELAVKGITLEDRPDGTTRWKR